MSAPETSAVATRVAPPPSRIWRANRHPQERYRIDGRGSLVVAVRAGDQLALTDLEGGQTAEVMWASSASAVKAQPHGGFAGQGLGVPDSDWQPATGFVALMQAGDGPASARHPGVPDSRRTQAALHKHGVDWTRAHGLRLFGPRSRAGAQQSLTVQADGLLIVAAPGDVLDVLAPLTATPLRLQIVRSTRQDGSGTDPDASPLWLPEPLADPLLERRVAAGTATAYVLRAGETVQIMDVAGRQCSDFQAFSLRQLDRGLDRALDATVTRTLTALSYPHPGLPAKAFDRDCTPLVEVVQDTCGRHDAFATACNARYYADQGYPGHLNCSDNFNAALAPYGVAPRPGWEALNFFYNTWLDAHHQLHLDEPWSRPGDYVLLRALTDVVCVSSSCPDDIDAANGWQPTDIHLRTYAASERFSIAMAHRATPEAEAVMTRETAFHPRTSALTQRFTDYRGFWLPQCYDNAGPIAEYHACREAVVMMDLSALRKFEVTGPDAEALLQYALTRDVSKLAVGQVVYSALCHPHGGMLDDGTLLRLGTHNFRWVCGDDYSGEWLRELAERQGYEAWVRSSTDQMHNLAVQGPRSRELLTQVLWTAPAHTPIASLGWFRWVPARLGGFDGAPVVVSRTGYTGELGYEVFCHPKDALTVFDALSAAGQPLGLRLMGLEALDMVRIEAGLVFAGQEFCDQTDPFEAGIGFTVPLKSKAVDFVGRDALLERQAHPQRRLVGLRIDSQLAPQHGDGVFVGRAQVGFITSAMRSPRLNQTIALARVALPHTALGTALEIGQLDGHARRLPATVVRFPHDDPDKTRVRA